MNISQVTYYVKSIKISLSRKVNYNKMVEPCSLHNEKFKSSILLYYEKTRDDGTLHLRKTRTIFEFMDYRGLDKSPNKFPVIHDLTSSIRYIMSRDFRFSTATCHGASPRYFR